MAPVREKEKLFLSNPGYLAEKVVASESALWGVHFSPQGARFRGIGVVGTADMLLKIYIKGRETKLVYLVQTALCNKT